MNWKTRITQITGIKYPLIMAAFAGSGRTEFAASFSNAGGLGIITALNYKLDEFRHELIKMKELTDKPYGINLTVIPPGVGFSDRTITKEQYLKYLEVAINEGVTIFTTSAYQATYIGERIHEVGCLWFHKCALMRHAISAQKAGVDAVTLIGMEAAGFKNPFHHTTLVNVTMAKELLQIPIIAAGGIGDARGFLGAIAMGAEAVCLGTAILTTEESPISTNIKENWISTDIFSEEYHKQLYHLSLKGTRVPSAAIGFQKEINYVKNMVVNIICEANDIVKSWGFTKEEFTTLNS